MTQHFAVITNTRPWTYRVPAKGFLEHIELGKSELYHIHFDPEGGWSAQKTGVKTTYEEIMGDQSTGVLESWSTIRSVNIVLRTLPLVVRPAVAFGFLPNPEPWFGRFISPRGEVGVEVERPGRLILRDCMDPTGLQLLAAALPDDAEVELRLRGDRGGMEADRDEHGRFTVKWEIIPNAIATHVDRSKQLILLPEFAAECCKVAAARTWTDIHSLPLVYVDLTT